MHSTKNAFDIDFDTYGVCYYNKHTTYVMILSGESTMHGKPPSQQIFEQNPVTLSPGHELSLLPATNSYPSPTNRDPSMGSFLFNIAAGTGEIPQKNRVNELILDLTRSDQSVIDLTTQKNATPNYNLVPTTFDGSIFKTDEFNNILKQRMPTTNLYYITCMKMLYACSLQYDDFEDAALTIEEVLMEDRRVEGEDVKELRVRDVNKQRRGLNSALVKAAANFARQQLDETKKNPPPVIQQLIDAVEQIEFGSSAIKYTSLAITVAAIIDPEPLLDAALQASLKR